MDWSYNKSKMQRTSDQHQASLPDVDGIKKVEDLFRVVLGKETV